MIQNQGMTLDWHKILQCLHHLYVWMMMIDVFVAIEFADAVADDVGNDGRSDDDDSHPK